VSRRIAGPQSGREVLDTAISETIEKNARTFYLITILDFKAFTDERVNNHGGLDMLGSTEEGYRKLAKHFYQTQLRGKKITKDTIISALKNCAGDYVPAYWRRLRNAIELDQREQGYPKAANEIKATANPITSDPKRKNEIKKKRRKVKSVSDTDEVTLLNRLNSGSDGDKCVASAITLVRYLGCRPAEIRDLEFLPGRKVRINSAKKRADRGIDRVLKIDDRALFEALSKKHDEVVHADFSNPIVYVQKRLAKVAHDLWPQRKRLLTLYSWRHQMGSDLKASGKSRIEVAAIMGHLSVESVNQYGRPKYAKCPREYLKATKNTMELVKPIEASIPPSKKITGSKPTSIY